MFCTCNATRIYRSFEIPLAAVAPFGFGVAQKSKCLGDGLAYQLNGDGIIKGILSYRNPRTHGL